MRPVRTRVAPSPTGDPHLGTAFIALFNYCYARHHGGQFIVRIEDTDRQRSTKASEHQILDALKWLGLTWDEGPDVGGSHGPYHQSERGEIYQKYTDELLQKQEAFVCFCSAERLGAMRLSQQASGATPKYDGHCLTLDHGESLRRRQLGETHVVRLKVPSQGECHFQDMLRGEVVIPWEQVDMQVLMKADGMPTYFLANVVDDHLMDITHVMRGEEWLPSAPKILRLYEAFGWPLPTLCYMPLLRNPDKSKLSKRKNPTSIDFYKRMGFIPQALLNYLGRMGWSMPDEREKFTLTEMVEAFDLHRISLGGPIFDLEKLKWLNGQWLRDLSAGEYAKMMREWGLNDGAFQALIPLFQSRVEIFSQILPLIGFMFSEQIVCSSQDLVIASKDEDTSRQFLQMLLWSLEALREWDKENIYAIILDWAKVFDCKIKEVMPLLFVAITGEKSSVSVIDAMEKVGPDISRFRLRQALGILGAPSKKEIKEWEKFFEQHKKTPSVSI